MKNLKSFVSLNLLSLLGFIFALFLFLVIFIIFPEVRQYDISQSGSDFDAQYGLVSSAYKWFMITLCAEIILFLLAIIEFVLKKINISYKSLIKINLPKNVQKLYSVLFYLGLVLSILPFCLLVITLF